MRHLPLLLALAGQSVASLVIPKSSVTSQVRVAYHGDSGMVVSWNTFVQLDQPMVRYGLAADALMESASSDVSVTYPTSLTYNNHVWIDGLLPDTLYYYQPQDLLANETVYGPYSFKTARPAGDTTPYTIAFVCDLGTMGPDGLSDIPNAKTDANEVLKPGEQNTIQSLASQLDTYDFLVHPGDLAYADYWLKEELAGYINVTIEEGPVAYETIQNEFFDQMEAISAFKPYMIGVGNHEANCDNGGSGSYDASICVPGQTNFTGVANHFRMPSDVSGGVGNFWYSFDHGMVHYIFFDTETDLGNGLLMDEASPYNAGPFGRYANEQVDWLAADLAAVDRCKTPWVVALGHRPWLASGDVCAACATAFAGLFEAHAVDLVLQGHFHVYERTVPVFANGTLDPHGYANPAAPWYLTNGLGGHWGGMDAFDAPLADFHAFGLDDADAVYGWSRLHFYNQTHVRHEFVASNNNSVLDTAVLYKEHVCPSAPSSTVTVSSTSTASPSSSLASSSVGSASNVASTASATASLSASASAIPSSVSSEAGCVEEMSSTPVVTSSRTSSSASSSPTVAATTATATITPSASPITSTILSTTTYTITSCALTVTDCPVGQVPTDVVTLYMTATEKTGTTVTTLKGTTTVPTSNVASVPVPSASGYHNTTIAATTTKAASSGILPKPAAATMSTATTALSGAAAVFGAGSATAPVTATAAPVAPAASSLRSGSATTLAASSVVTAGASSLAISAAGMLLAVMVGAAVLL